ncbi:alpha/beta hydrolase [Thermobifida halotolerans]|uniref:Alpha/beta hydrolase n=2 Tax=Thermobifida halotolerans TaxID=483545 RepID=A0AA97M6I8_9ACTN|nr:alpha/beta hydrolase [Thermobifida halotolerans]
MVIGLHAFEPPRSEAALAGTLPLLGLPVWRFYLGLPLFGHRLPEGGVPEVNRLGQTDYLIQLYGPVVEQAAAELPRVVAELRRSFPVSEAPAGLMGVGAGGAAVFLALAEGDLPVGAVGVVNPVIDPAQVLAARERHLGITYHWSDKSREIATWLDFTERAEELASRDPQPPMLIVNGEHDEIIRPGHGRLLHDALASRHLPHTLRHIVVPDLAHALGPEPGLDPGPPTPGTVLADRALAEWFHAHLLSGAETTVRL